MIKNAFPATTPCNHTFTYPPEIANLAAQEGKHAVFMINNDKGDQAYIATTFSGISERLELIFPVSGTPEQISEIYDDILWDEVEVSNENGPFIYKQAPSVQAMEDCFDRLVTTVF